VSWSSTEYAVVVRNLRPSDLEAVVTLDAKNVGRRRDEYFRVKLRQNRRDRHQRCPWRRGTSSFAGSSRGSTTASSGRRSRRRCWTIDVHPDFRGHGVGTALLRRLTNDRSGSAASRPK
jgi:ribosomal protein S18 acetylase RimI-like enzyme